MPRVKVRLQCGWMHMVLPFAIIISELCAPCGNGNLPRGNLIPLNETIEHHVTEGTRLTQTTQPIVT